MTETNLRFHYILRDGVPCLEPDPIAWALWADTDDPHIDRTEVGPRCRVATYLRRIEVAGPGTRRDVFESRVFGGPLNGRTRHYKTLGEAKSGHWDLVDLSRKGQSLGERLRRVIGLSRAGQQA